MALKDEKLISLNGLQIYNEEILKLLEENKIWVGTCQKYEDNKDSITQKYVILTDDGVQFSKVQSAIADGDVDMDDVFSDEEGGTP